MENWMQKSHTECIAGGRTGREFLLGDINLNVKIKGECVVNSDNTCTGVRNRDMNIEYGT